MLWSRETRVHLVELRVLPSTTSFFRLLLPLVSHPVFLEPVFERSTKNSIMVTRFCVPDVPSRTDYTE